MKVVGKTTDKSETSVDIDLFEGQRLPKRVKKLVNEAVGEYLIEQTLISVEQERSPVSGQGSFAPLSGTYKKLKKREVGNTRPNLEANGDMKDQLDYQATDVLTLGVFGDRAGAADGHNHLSNKTPRIPKRQFLPDEGQKYKAGIAAEINRIKADIIAEETNFKPSQFKNVYTPTDLYATLRGILGLNTRAEINLAVLRNPDLENFLNDQGLFDLLKF